MILAVSLPIMKLFTDFSLYSQYLLKDTKKPVADYCKLLESDGDYL